MPTDRIAELRALIAASQAAHDACRTRSDVPLRERLAIRDDAAAAMYAAMERDMPALLDCAEALQKLTFVARTSGGTAGRDEDLVAACEQAEAALRALNGDDHD